MFSYNDFKSFVKNDGLARQNRFYIRISVPSLKGPAAAMFDIGKMKDIHMLCQSVTVPSASLATAPVRYTGESFEAPYDRTFSPATFTFYVDRQMYVRKFFEAWIDSVQDYKERTFSWYNDFVSPYISVFTVDRKSKDTYETILFEAHPKSIGDLQLDQNSNDVMTMTVQLEYHYSTSILHNGSSGSTGGGPRQSSTDADYYASLSDESRDMLSPMDSWVDSMGLGGYMDNFLGNQGAMAAALNTSGIGLEATMGRYGTSYTNAVQAASSILTGEGVVDPSRGINNDYDQSDVY